MSKRNPELSIQTGIRENLFNEIHKIIVGQDRVIEELVIALISKGHCLLIGVPGLAKTLLINTLAKTLGLTFKRIQFTPDLMPSDITGTEVLYEDENRNRAFKFVRGPIFTHILLSDEINRTPPKTQSALLEAMQELQVTIGGVKYSLEEPFFTLATQNPIEQEGTYPLPEAQLDRFMLNTFISYPSYKEEMEIVSKTTGGKIEEVNPILSRDDILTIQNLVRELPVPEHVLKYAVKLVHETRPQTSSFKSIKKYVSYGASPRASQYLILGAKAKAFLEERDYPETKDVKFIAPSVLRHRILLNFTAEAEGIEPDMIIEDILDKVDWEKEL